VDGDNDDDDKVFDDDHNHTDDSKNDDDKVFDDDNNHDNNDVDDGDNKKNMKMKIFMVIMMMPKNIMIKYIMMI